jgi:hypothetical protein
MPSDEEKNVTHRCVVYANSKFVVLSHYERVSVVVLQRDACSPYDAL